MNTFSSVSSAPLLKRPKAIIFDWDNTLVDSWNVIHQALNATLEDFGLRPWTLAETQTNVAKSMRDSFPILFGDAWERAGQVYHEHFAAIHLERLAPLPEAGSALADLAEAGFHLSVVSNKTGKFLRAEAEKLGWDQYFANVIGAGDAEADKPAAAPVRLALKGSGIDPGGDVWFVGDAPIDMECALNTGCVPVLLREKVPQEEEFNVFRPRIHFATPQKLSNHAKNL